MRSAQLHALLMRDLHSGSGFIVHCSLLIVEAFVVIVFYCLLFFIGEEFIVDYCL